MSFGDCEGNLKETGDWPPEELNPQYKRVLGIGQDTVNRENKTVSNMSSTPKGTKSVIRLSIGV